jgi:hypothetical protein
LRNSLVWKFDLRGTERLLLENYTADKVMTASQHSKGGLMVRVNSNQKFFTEEEVAKLTGICQEHLRGFARHKHIGTLTRAAEALGAEAQKWLFSRSDLMILTVIHPRCDH